MLNLDDTTLQQVANQALAGAARHPRSACLNGTLATSYPVSLLTTITQKHLPAALLT
jgi:hypothetical protein